MRRMAKASVTQSDDGHALAAGAEQRIHLTLQLEADGFPRASPVSGCQPRRVSPYGQKYEILGPLTGPNGNTAWVRTIWIVLTGETVPRLVTLIPAEKP